MPNETHTPLEKTTDIALWYLNKPKLVFSQLMLNTVGNVKKHESLSLNRLHRSAFSVKCLCLGLVTLKRPKNRTVLTVSQKCSNLKCLGNN